MSNLCLCFKSPYRAQVNNQSSYELPEKENDFKNQLRILLLGTAASGKTTFLTSLRMIHSQKFSEAELTNYKHAIYSNIFSGMARVLTEKKLQKLDWQLKGTEKFAKKLIKLINLSYQKKQLYCNEISRNNSQLQADASDCHAGSLIDEGNQGEGKIGNDFDRIQVVVNDEDFSDAAQLLAKLWSDPTCSQIVQSLDTAVHNEETSECGKNLAYYLPKVEEIAAQGYRPSDEDILHIRQLTTKVSETEFQLKGKTLSFIDVGGHTNARSQWNSKVLKVFSGAIHCIIYLIPVSAFNEVYEKKDPHNNNEERVNKLDESIRCLHHIFDRKAALQSVDLSLIVFFNKDDLLQDKIVNRKIDLSQYDHEYTPPQGNPHCIESVRKHLSQRLDKALTDLNKNSNFTPRLYKHFTISIDLGNVRKVFADVRTTVLNNFVDDMFAF